MHAHQDLTKSKPILLPVLLHFIDSIINESMRTRETLCHDMADFMVNVFIAPFSFYGTPSKEKEDAFETECGVTFDEMKFPDYKEFENNMPLEMKNFFNSTPTPEPSVSVCAFSAYSHSFFIQKYSDTLGSCWRTDQSWVNSWTLRNWSNPAPLQTLENTLPAEMKEVHQLYGGGKLLDKTEINKFFKKQFGIIYSDEMIQRDSAYQNTRSCDISLYQINRPKNLISYLSSLLEKIRDENEAHQRRLRAARGKEGCSKQARYFWKPAPILPSDYAPCSLTRYIKSQQEEKEFFLTLFLHHLRCFHEHP